MPSTQTLRYGKLYSVLLLHEYYAQRTCPDLEATPCQDTKAFLERQALRFVPERGAAQFGWSIYYRIGTPPDPYRALPDDHRFLFFLRRADHSFDTITEIDAVDAGMIRYFTNDSLLTLPSSSISSGSQYLHRPKRFLYTFEQTGGTTADPESVSVVDVLTGETLESYSVDKGDDDIYRVEIDLGKWPAGRCQLLHGTYDDLDHVFFATDEPLRDVWAVLEVSRSTSDGAWPYGTPVVKALQFGRKEVVWKYWVIRQPKTAGGTPPTVYFADDPPTGSPSVYPSTLNLSKYGTLGDYELSAEESATLAALQARYPDAEIDLYLSTVEPEGADENDTLALPYYEIPRQGIQLWQDTPSELQLYFNLPCAQRKQVKPEIFVYAEETGVTP